MRYHLRKIYLILLSCMMIWPLTAYAQEIQGEKNYTVQLCANESGTAKSIRVSPKNITVAVGTTEAEIREKISIAIKYQGENKWIPVMDYKMSYDEIKDKVGTHKVEIQYTNEGSTVKTILCVKICPTKVRSYIAYVGGYEDDTFRADQPVTREELATMIARILTEGNVPEQFNTYPDLDPNRYSTAAINYVTKIGVFAPYEDGTFKAKNPVSGQEVKELVGKLEKYTIGTTNGFKQKNDLLTRAEAVVLLNRLFQRKCAGQTFPNKYSDLQKNYWAYRDIVCATNAFSK